jgi:signal transduction histidine kinase
VELMAEYLGSFVQRLDLETRLVDSAIDHERERIARDLHDSLSQTLYAAAFNAEALSLAVTTDSDLAAESAVKIRVMVLSALAEIRTLLFELQPAETGLAELIKTLCTSLEEIYGTRIQLSVVGDGPAVPPRPKLAIYRIGQEALNNVFRHSGADDIHVTIGVDEHGARIIVSDDGVGFEVDTISTGHGLRNIRERAGEVGASIDITSSTASGTTLSATWLRAPTEPTLDLTLIPGMEQTA